MDPVDEDDLGDSKADSPKLAEGGFSFLAERLAWSYALESIGEATRGIYERMSEVAQQSLAFEL